MLSQSLVWKIELLSLFKTPFYLLKNMGFLTIFQCGCCDMDDLCLGSARHRRGPIAMKTLPLSRPGDTLECKTEERCPGTPALIGASLCTRVAVHRETPGLALLSCFALTHRAPGSHTPHNTPHTPCTRLFFHTSRLPSEAFMPPRARKQLSVNIPGGVILSPSHHRHRHNH